MMTVMITHTCDPDTVKRIKSLFKGSNDMLAELVLTISEHGITMRMLDASSAALVEWNIPSTVMYHYEYNHSEDEIVICVDAGSAFKATDKASTRIEFAVTNTQEQHGKLEIISERAGVRHVDSLELLTPPEKPVKKPNLPDSNVRLSFKGKVFKKIVKAAKGLGGYMEIKVPNKQHATMGVYSPHGDDYRAELTSMFEGDFEIEYFKERSKCLYALNYMYEYKWFIMDNDRIHFYFTSNKPHTVTCGGDGINVKLILAPRMDKADRKGDEW